MRKGRGMRLSTTIALTIAAAAVVFAVPASAAPLRPGGKLLLTGGVSSIEGSAGGGLATWAMIAGNETDAGIGGAAHATVAALPDFTLTSFGAKAGFFDRLELSYARQRFDTRDAGAELGLGRGFMLGQHVLGAKLRLAGDAVWDQDRLMPQIAVGVHHKIADNPGLVHALGAGSRSGTDVYVAASKVLLAQSLVLGGTARLTNANQTGLLGFGGDRGGRGVQFEGSAGWLATRRLLIGGEYRTKPDNLAFAKEDDAFDLFAAYALTRSLSLTAAYLDMGSIVTFERQRGGYLSIQTAF